MTLRVPKVTKNKSVVKAWVNLSYWVVNIRAIVINVVLVIYLSKLKFYLVTFTRKYSINTMFKINIQTPSNECI
jgi:hypothetical protein